MFDQSNQIVSSIATEWKFTPVGPRAKLQNYRVIFINDEAETFGGIQHFFLMKKIGYFTFYGAQYINLVKY